MPLVPLNIDHSPPKILIAIIACEIVNLDWSLCILRCTNLPKISRIYEMSGKNLNFGNIVMH